MDRPIQRSRKGCWTCKRRHKKCDETLPVCKRCTDARMTCEGFELRLVWGSSNPEIPGAGALLNPIRGSRRRRSSKDVAEIASNLDDCVQNTSPALCLDKDGSSTTLGGLGHEFSGEPDQSISALDDGGTSERLLREFLSSGHRTLTGRCGYWSFAQSEIQQFCENSGPCRLACLSYQASLDESDYHLAPIYLHAALSGYFCDIKTPERLYLDTTLATGIIICSTSISCRYPWTPLLRGLRDILQQRGLFTTTSRPLVTTHLFEIIALLDIPFLILNRKTESMHLWSTYVASQKKLGIEQASGLPYSLFDILCNLESSSAESRLSEWIGEVGTFNQMHLWEAFRTAGIIHSRALRKCLNVDDGPHHQPTPNLEILRWKVFASIKAIIDSGAPSSEQPFYATTLYPLFIGGIFTEDDAREIEFCRHAFKSLLDSGERRKHQLVWDIVVDTWEAAKVETNKSRLAGAEDIAAKLDVEVYLY